MNKNNRKWIVALLLIGFAALILQEMWSRPGMEDLPGSFREVAFVRNEQNKGGIVRIYAFTVSDTALADYAACGDRLPHNEYGSVTKAYFFYAGDRYPSQLNLATPHFDTTRYRPVALYIKDDGESGAVQRFQP